MKEKNPAHIGQKRREAGAPGMASAMAVLTARLASINGTMSTHEYVAVLRQEAAEQDPLVLLSAVASIASAMTAIAASAQEGVTPERLLSSVGLTLATTP